MDYLNKLYNEGRTELFGYMVKIRGIVIYNTATLEQARRMAEQDPAVKSGRLVVEVHPW